MTSDGSQRSCSVLEAFGREHRTGLLTILFTDIVGSTALKQRCGEHQAVALIQRHHATLRELLGRFPDAQEVETAGDSFLLVFARPSEAVKFSLQLQARIEVLAQETGQPVLDRIGIHVGEVFIRGQEESARLFGSQVDVCARLMGLAEANQVLMTRFAFDNARRMVRAEELEGIGPLRWLNHGLYRLKGVEEAVEVCEVRAGAEGPVTPPTGSEKAQRLAGEGELVLGWRPAVGQVVPNTQWVLEEKLGEGGFGEVWLGRHRQLKERRVFKFCFQAERVRSLKREMTLFRLLKERIGVHPNIVGLYEVCFDQPPFYLEEEYIEGRDLRAWWEAQGGMEKVSPETRLEIVAQAAEALQAAHEAGIIHRDIKPGNILIADGRWPMADWKGSLPSAVEAQAEAPTIKTLLPNSKLNRPSAIGPRQILVKLTDFGIGQVISAEYLQDITKAGFTQTMLSPGSSQTGTQLYMAPELLSGTPATTRSDIYSLGVVLYQLLVGDLKRPVTMDWAQRINDPLLREDLQLCFAGNPNERFAGAGQLAAHLRALPERRAELERRRAEQAALERAAYRRGMLRTAGVAAVVVALIAGLAIVALNQGRRAKASAAAAHHAKVLAQAAEAAESAAKGQVKQRLLRLHVANGLRLAEAGDFAGALLWFTAALELEQGDARREAIHRFRMTSLLQQLPQLRQIYFLNGSITDVELNPRSDWLAAASDEGVVQVWNLATATAVSPPIQHSNRVARICFSPDGTGLATGTADGSVRIWRAATGEPLTPVMAHSSAIRQIIFSPDGTRLFTGSAGGLVRAWRATNGEALGSIQAHAGNVAQIALSPDGRLLLTAGEDRKVQLLDSTTFAARHPPWLHNAPVVWAAFTPNGQTFLTATADARLRLWEVATGQAILSHLTAAQAVWGIFTPDGRWLVALSPDRRVRVLDTESGAPLGPMVWEAERGAILSPTIALGTAITSMALSACGRYLVTAGTGHTARVWDLAEEPRPDSIFHTGAVCEGLFSPQGQWLLTASQDGSARVWDAATVQPITPLLQHRSAITQAAFSPDGLRLVTASRDGTARVWNATNGAPVTAFLSHPGPVNCVAFSPDGQRILTGCDDRTARMWNGFTGEPSGPVFQHASSVTGVSFAPNGRTVLTLSSNLAQLWNAQTAQPILGALTHPAAAIHAEFNSDGSRLATACADGYARLWETATGRLAAQTARHLGAVLRVGFSPDGRRIVTASADGSARVWDTATGQAVSKALVHNRAVVRALFSPEGQRVFTLSWDTTARVWDAETGEPITLPLRHHRELLAGSFNPSGTQVVTCSRDLRARIWDVRQDERPIPVLTGWAQFLAERRIDETGGLVPLSEAQLAEKWEALRRQYPQYCAIAPSELPQFHQQKAELCERARQWSAAAFHLQRCRPAAAPEDSEWHRRLVRVQAERERALREATVLQHWPPRLPQAPPSLIDLSDYYNGALTEDWQTAKQSSLADLPRGMQALAGITFDLRGVIQLSGQGARVELKRSFPERAEGILIRQKARRFHFLHACSWAEPEGTEIASYIIHFTNHERWVIPVRYGRDVRDWWAYPYEVNKPGAQVIWTGSNPDSQRLGMATRLFHSQWNNPRPEMEIDHLDFVSAMRNSAPFLIAITLE